VDWHPETIDVGGVLQRIGAMLARGRAPGAEPLTWPEVERLLTEGYAITLALDGERLRIDRRISKLGSVGDPKLAARMLPRLNLRRGAVERDIRRLRDSLDELSELATQLQSSVETGPGPTES
jgi:hypothetical protein